VNLQIRRSGHIVQERPLPVVYWIDVPGLSAPVGRYPSVWQQLIQDSSFVGGL
jgi:hypothetical protein